MKTIFWKELREHARWVPLGFIPMVIVLVLMWRSNELIIFNGSEYWIFVGLLAAGIAPCLGLIQSWPDQRPASRALLLHRGITADAAFGGKLLAGMSLYAVAVFVPLLGMAAFTAYVGIEYRAASPGALLPSLLISITAFSCWTASMLVVQRDAWFVGSRLLPGLTAALAVFAFGSMMREVLWLANILALVTLVVFLAAARSVFVNSSQMATGIGRAGLALIVTVALLAITMWLGAFVDSYRRSVRFSTASDGRNYYVVLGPDGRPWLLRTTRSRYGDVADQSAKMVPDKSVRDQLQSIDGAWKSVHVWSPAMQTYQYRERLGQRFVRMCGASVPSNTEHVYRTWVFDNKLDAVLVYRSIKFNRYRLEATLTPPASAESFGRLQTLDRNDEAGNFTMVTSTGVYRVPGDGSQVETIYSIPPPSKLLGCDFGQEFAAPLANSQAGSPVIDFRRFGLLLRLDDRVVLLESNPPDTSAKESLGGFSGLNEIFATEVRLPTELATTELLSIARDPAGDETYVGLARNPREAQRVSWFRFGVSGEIEEQARYDAEPTTVAVTSNWEIVALMPPGVFAFGATMVAIENPNPRQDFQKTWEDARKAPAQTIGIVLFAMLQPIIGVPLAFWAARRRALDKRSTRWWMFWAFWSGLYGSLALLAVYPRIMREPCGACHKAARIDIAFCEHCDHSLDETPKTGREISDRGQTSLAISTQPATI